jgi:hypothetical protein
VTKPELMKPANEMAHHQWNWFLDRRDGLGQETYPGRSRDDVA